MKNKIKPFILRLIKENIFYIIGNLFIFILIIISIKIGFTEKSKYDKKIVTLKVELNQLQNKVNILNSSIPTSNKLDEDISFLNALIPNIEDYFSIIYALEKLSLNSNFIINSYTVSIGKSTSQKLKLSVTGMGDSESFINFLKNYNFAGGRLITSDKIQLDPNFVGSIKIDLTFYTKKVTANQNLESNPDEKVFNELETLKNKVNFAFDVDTASSAPDFNYPRKSNPF